MMRAIVWAAAILLGAGAWTLIALLGVRGM
jgi:hypothetical protein